MIWEFISIFTLQDICECCGNAFSLNQFVHKFGATYCQSCMQHDRNLALKNIKEELKLLEKGIPVEWDRVSIADNDFPAVYNIFGWIKRRDGKRDFVVYSYVTDTISMFVTSSAKFSKKMSENWKTTHSDCIKFSDWMKEV